MVEGVKQAHTESWWGAGENRNLGASLAKIILVNTVSDKNALITFFTGDPEDNYRV